MFTKLLNFDAFFWWLEVFYGVLTLTLRIARIFVLISKTFYFFSFFIEIDAYVLIFLHLVCVLFKKLLNILHPLYEINSIVFFPILFKSKCLMVIFNSFLLQFQCFY